MVTSPLGEHMPAFRGCQVFDVGQQKALLRATGNSPMEPLNCRELGKAGGGGGRGGGEPARRTAIQREALATSGTCTVFSYQDLLI